MSYLNLILLYKFSFSFIKYYVTLRLLQTKMKEHLFLHE